MQSKWETVNPEDVEAQAMTISKWEQMEKDNVDGEPLEDEPAVVSGVCAIPGWAANRGYML